MIYLRMCELPVASEDMTLANFIVYEELKEAFECAEAIANGSGPDWLVLSGGIDCGKTHLAVALCRHWISRGKPAKYAYVPLLLHELREGYDHEGDESFTYRFNVYCSVPMLVLDDLGAEHTTPWAQEKLDTIIDYRLMHALPLVITTNLMIEELPPRISSRVQRHRHAHLIGIDAPEFRLRGG